MMEIRINKEIRHYRETIFFGLSLRQFICAALSVVVAILLYLLLHNGIGDDVIGREAISWICIIGALPIAIAGFFHYNGMTFEQFLWAWLKSEILLSGKRVWKAENYYYLLLKQTEKPEKTPLDVFLRKRSALDETKKFD